jgi:hypothetical protein
MARKSWQACDASLDCLEAESTPCLSLLLRVQRLRQSMIRGLMIRRSHFSLSNLVLRELRET